LEIEIDFAVKSKYGDYHDFYSRNLKYFKRFVRVFEYFFKKEKYKNSEIKIDEEVNDRAIIKFCSEKYQMNLLVTPANIESAAVVFLKKNTDQWLKIGEVGIDRSGNAVFPGNKKISLEDDYEFSNFNNAVLDHFFSGIIKKMNVKPAAK
jgi:cytochrome b involved in lipid metabolism